MLSAFNAGLGRKVGHPYESFDVLGAAVRITTVVESINSDENIATPENLGPRQREREKDRVTSRHVSDGYALPHFLNCTAFRNFYIARQCGASEDTQINLGDDMLVDIKVGGNATRGFDFNFMPLPIPKSQCVNLITLALRNGEGCR